MINKILNAIVNKLGSLNLPIYVEEVSQDLKESCFLILPLTSSIKKVIGNRYRSNHSFEVYYYPPQKDANVSMNNIGQQLFELLEYIQTEEGLLRGTDMHLKKANGVLHFFVSYNFFSYGDIQNEMMMNGVSVNNGLKEG